MCQRDACCEERENAIAKHVIVPWRQESPDRWNKVCLLSIPCLGLYSCMGFSFLGNTHAATVASILDPCNLHPSWLVLASDLTARIPAQRALASSTAASPFCGFENAADHPLLCRSAYIYFVDLHSYPFAPLYIHPSQSSTDSSLFSLIARLPTPLHLILRPNHCILLTYADIRVLSITQICLTRQP